MGVAVIPISTEAPSQNTLKEKGQVEASFQPRLDLPATISGIGVKDPAVPSTEASSGQDATDLFRMMLSEIEAIAGQKRPISDYVRERARRRRKQGSRPTKVSGRGDRKR